ncbi:MAG: type 1 glutamine amidotransferase [Halobacteriota archaeon]
MSRVRLALLDASHNFEETPRNFRRELDADLAEFDVTTGELPPSVASDGPIGSDSLASRFDGVVVTGSRSAAYEEEPWIRELTTWLAAAADAGAPILGVCFGHQVLSTALGGRVEAMGEYELGYRQVTHRGGDLFDGIRETFTVFTTHSDAVVELPPDATLLAENDYGVHAFRKGHCFGVQFHPEYDIKTATRVTREKPLDDGRIRAVVDGITPANFEAACEAKRLFDNFTEYARRVRREKWAGPA